VTLTESALEFSANSINRSVTKGQLDSRIPLTEITSVTVEFGVVTKDHRNWVASDDLESPQLRSGKASRTNQGSNSKYRELTIIG